MDMKKMLGIVSEKQLLNENTDESCMAQSPMAAPAMPTPPVSMTVNMNASGVDQIKELLNLMSSAQSAPATPPTPLTLPAITPLTKTPLQGTANEYANDDESEVMDLDAIIRNGDDLHKEKGAYKATQPGDNAMAVESIKEKLYAQLAEKKKS